MYIVRDNHRKAPMYVHFMRYPLNAGPIMCLQCIPWGIPKLFHSFYSSNFQHGCTSILICTEHHTSLQPGKTSKNWQFAKESGKILCSLVAPQIEFGDRDNFLSPGLSSYNGNERFDLESRILSLKFKLSDTHYTYRFENNISCLWSQSIIHGKVVQWHWRRGWIFFGIFHISWPQNIRREQIFMVPTS